VSDGRKREIYRDVWFFHGAIQMMFNDTFATNRLYHATGVGPRDKTNT